MLPEQPFSLSSSFQRIRIKKGKKRQNGRHCCDGKQIASDLSANRKKKNWKSEPSPSPVSAISTIVSLAIEEEMKESIQMSAACEDRSAGGKWKPPKTGSALFV